MSMKGKLRGLDDKQLEIFVRQRLGQDDAIFNEHLEDHKRLSLHSATSKDLINNMEIIALFDDIWDAGDHYHTPIITGYKGSLNVGSTNHLECGLYSGWGTVEVLCDIIRKWVNSKTPCFNGNYKLDTDGI